MMPLLLVTILATLIYFFHDVLLIAFGGVLVAVLLSKIVDGLQSKLPVPRWIALVFAIVVPAAGIGLMLMYGGALLFSQYEALRSAIPDAVQAGINNLKAGPLASIVPVSASDVQSLAGSALALAQRATGMVSSTLGLIVASGVMAFVGVCIAAEPALYRAGIVTLIPQRHRANATNLLNAIGATLGAWLVARLVSMVAIAVLVSIGLTLLQIPYSVALGLLAGVLAFIPNIGALVAGIPAVVLALAVGPQRAGMVIAMYWLAHTLDDFIVIPIVERRIVHLPPALTILMQLALGGATGVLGVAFAAPLTAAAMVITRILWIDPRAGDGNTEGEIKVKAQRGSLSGVGQFAANPTVKR